MKPRHSLAALWLTLAGLLLAGGLGAAPRPDGAITAGEVRDEIRYLASDELAGRGSGTPGGQMAARYVAEHFAAAHLKPAGDGGAYFQNFPVITGAELGKDNSLEIRLPRGKTLEPTIRQDFLPAAFSASGESSGSAVFAGYGISQPDLKHDDYQGIDVRGKVVIALRKTPEGDEGRKLEAYATLRSKAATARDHGAAAILLVTGPLSGDDENLGRMEPDGSFADTGIPALLVRRRFVDAMLATRSKNLADVQTAMAHGGPPALDLPDVQVRVHTSIELERRETANVIGLLEGGDPQLENEVIVIGAHYDHLGMGGPASLNPSPEPAIHHGADDNASGTAGVMELAQYFAAQPARPRRSLLFICFSGEELGLLGSAYYVRHPTLPLDRTVAMINMDMVGRMQQDTLQILGTGTSPDWKALLDAVGPHFSLKTKTSGSGFGASDQSSFYARNIPVLFFFTGVHPDYHRPTDTWEKINAEGEVKVLQFVAETTERVADMPQRPRFARADDSAPASPGFSVYLGSIPDYSDNARGVALTGVREGSPAEKAGLKAGDVIVEFGSRKIANVYDYTYALRDAKPNVPVDVVVLRGDQRLKLTVVPKARN